MSFLGTQLDIEFLIMRFGARPPPSTSDDEGKGSFRNVHQVHFRTDETRNIFLCAF